MTWRVGVLFSQTGVTAAIERSQLNGTLLAVDEINKAGGVLGRPIEPNIYDPASNPKQFRALAERLLTADRVRLIFGCYMSSTRKAVLPVVEAFRGLLFYPTLYEGFEYSLHCIYTGAAPNQNSLQLAKYLLQHYGNRFLLIGSNYIYPYESNRVMADFISQSKGKVLDELYVPLDAQAKDFNKAISKIAALKPDVVFSTVVGQSTAVFYEAYRRAGFDPNKMPIASLTTSEAEVAEMSPEAAEGHITAAPFFEALATAAARRFISAYKLRYGADTPVTGRIIVRRLYGRMLDTLLATWGIGILIQQAVRLEFGLSFFGIHIDGLGPGLQNVTIPDALQGAITIGGIDINTYRAFIILVTIIFTLITWFLLFRTSIGTQVRAIIRNRQMAAACGIDVERINALTFAFGAGLAGVAGVMMSGFKTVFPDMGTPMVVDGFLVVVVGGIGSLLGSVLSAGMLGEINGVVASVSNDIVARAVVFGVVILIIVLKPKGLFSFKER